MQNPQQLFLKNCQQLFALLTGKQAIPASEWVQQLQQWVQAGWQTIALTKDKQQQPAVQHYFTLLLKHQEECLTLLQQKITTELTPLQWQQTLLEWIETCEDLYTQLLATDEYQRAYGQLINQWLISMPVVLADIKVPMNLDLT